MTDLSAYSKQTASVLAEPFEWCFVQGGPVTLGDAAERGGTPGSRSSTADFAISRYLITNAQYERFVVAPEGYANPGWWGFSEQGIQWRQTRKSARATAFPGQNLPRTRVSWFESLAFCAWLSAQLHGTHSFDIGEIHSWPVRLPTEREWQRAALGDSQGPYPWGEAPVTPERANCGNWAGGPTDVECHPLGASPYGVQDMSGNLSEWCLTRWGSDEEDAAGYAYRNIRGGAWNLDPASVFLRADDRAGHPPRGRLNDFGFRVSSRI